MSEHDRVSFAGLDHMHPDAIGIDEFVRELGHDRFASGWFATVSPNLTILRNRQYVRDRQNGRPWPTEEHTYES